MRNSIALAALWLASLAGCGARWSWAIQQAAFDHQCPEERVRVVRASADRRSLEMDICGASRRYQEVSGKGLAWVDVTVD